MLGDETMKTPTHEEIAKEAYRIWQEEGCPNGQDLDIWLRAQRQLHEKPARTDHTRSGDFAERAKEETAAESVVEYQITPAVAEQDAIKAAMPKEKVTPRKRATRERDQARK